MTEVNDVRTQIKMARRNNAKAIVNLSKRRNWFDETPEPAPATTPQEGQQIPDNAGDGGKTSSNPETLTLTQDALDKMMGGRAEQAKRSLLKSLGVEDVATLQTMVETHTKAEEARLAADEAAKTNEQRLADEITQLKDFQVVSANKSNHWQMVAAIQRLAPDKSIPAERFTDLLTLMDTSSITAKDGVIDDKDVEAAIDKTLEGRDYLKVETTATQPNKSNGSPKRKQSIYGRDKIEPQAERKRMKV